MLFQRTSIFVKEHVSLLKLRDTYDLLDPDSQTLLGQAKDEPPSWAKWMRLLVKKALLPTTVNVYPAGAAQPALRIHKRPGFLRTRLEVRDHQGQFLAGLRSKVFSLGGAFEIQDSLGNAVGELKGDWVGWDYQAHLQGRKLGVVTKKWA